MDLRDPLLLLPLPLSLDSVTLLNSAEDVVDGEEVDACLLDVPWAFLLIPGLAATGLFTTFFFEVDGATTGWGEGTAAGDTDLEFVVLVSLSMIEEVVVVSLVDEYEEEDEPELDIGN